ncbi:MAG TPA: hypothetical protein DDZ37_05010, partial [Spirochaetaceae bacterium]|nr:hypothetical protein [Spirochaetaceae bacterium]
MNFSPYLQLAARGLNADAEASAPYVYKFFVGRKFFFFRQDFQSTVKMNRFAVLAGGDRPCQIKDRLAADRAYFELLWRTLGLRFLGRRVCASLCGRSRRFSSANVVVAGLSISGLRWIIVRFSAHLDLPLRLFDSISA